MTLRVNAIPQLVMARPLPGGQAEIQNIDIRFWYGASEIVATGNLVLSDDGKANGDLEVAAKNLKDLAAFLQTLPAHFSTPAQQTVGYLISIGRPGKDANGNPVSQLKLTVRDNDIYAGDRLIASIMTGS